MHNAIATAKWKKSDKYNDLVDVLCRGLSDSDVRFRAMVVGVMKTVPTSSKQTLREIQPKAQTSWLIHQIYKAISNHNHKLWITWDQLHNGRQNFPNEDMGRGSWNADGSNENILSIVRTLSNSKNKRCSRENLRWNVLNCRTGRKYIGITTRYLATQLDGRGPPSIQISKNKK